VKPTLLFLLPLLEARATEKSVHAIGAMDENRAIFHEDRIKRAMNERHSVNSAAGFPNRFYQCGMLPQCAPWRHTSNLHMRVDSPTHIETAFVISGRTFAFVAFD